MKWFKHFFKKSSFFVGLDATSFLFRIYRKAFKRQNITELFTTGVQNLYKSRSYVLVCLSLFSLKSKRLIAQKKNLQKQMQINANKHKSYFFLFLFFLNFRFLKKINKKNKWNIGAKPINHECYENFDVFQNIFYSLLFCKIVIGVLASQ